MNDKLNFKDWYKEKYDPTGYLYPSAPLSIGFQDYCARVNEYLEYLANGVDTRTEPALPIQNVDLKNETPIDANNVLVSLIQAKYAAMIEGKKIRHSSFMDNEYIYYKNGCWFTHHDCQMPEVCFLNEQEQGWWNDSWSVVS